MELILTPQQHLCPLEALLSIYTPILECLVSHLPTPSKLALSQTSRSLRQLLHQYPRFFADLDFRLSVFESAHIDSYSLGTVYNLDKLLQSLPVDGRIVSLTLDWTAVGGSFLFGTILNHCSQTLEHLSVRGCRKVSIKHHIVPHFVYQSSIYFLREHGRNQKPPPALKSIYVYKARGVRRKPFMIDRKPADGDEPSRFLTTLTASLGVWVDFGLCPTPKLRCPRRREVPRRGKENYCVPFDKRWRVQDENESLSEAENTRRRALEQSAGVGLECWNCAAEIPERCDGCVHQMTCSSCQKPLCHNCAYLSRTQLGQAMNQAAAATAAQVAAGNVVTAASPAQWIGAAMLTHPHAYADQDDNLEAELSAIPSKLLNPCCRTAPGTHADNLCAPCYAQTRRDACSLCDRPICIKHELERCRRCEGGCERLFCFSTTDNREAGCGEPETGRAQMKDCIGCGMDVCGECRTNFANNQRIQPSPSPSPSSASSSADDDDGSESTISAGDGARASGRPVGKTSCGCKVCIDNYYCPACWPNKPIPCEPRPTSILQQRIVMDGNVTLLQISFKDPTEPVRWYTQLALSEQHPQLYDSLLEEFNSRQQLKNTNISFIPSATPAAETVPSDLLPADAQISVATDEWILERVLAVKDGLDCVPPAEGDDLVLCKWLGKTMAEVTWERNKSFLESTHPRERRMVDMFMYPAEGKMMEAEEGEQEGEAMLI